MYKNILLPTDFSDNAWRAASYILQLYAKEAGTFYFMHAAKLKVSSAAVRSSKLSTVMAENNKLELNELVEKAKKTFPNSKHEFKVILSPEDLQDAILQAVQTFKINLVVMGTKGASKAKGIFFGSNTVASILKIKDCPILLVPEESVYKSPEQIAFPTDFNRFYGEELEPIAILKLGLGWFISMKKKI